MAITFKVWLVSLFTYATAKGVIRAKEPTISGEDLLGKLQYEDTLFMDHSTDWADNHQKILSEESKAVQKEYAKKNGLNFVLESTPKLPGLSDLDHFTESDTDFDQVSNSDLGSLLKNDMDIFKDLLLDEHKKNGGEPHKITIKSEESYVDQPDGETDGNTPLKRVPRLISDSDMHSIEGLEFTELFLKS